MVARRSHAKTEEYASHLRMTGTPSRYVDRYPTITLQISIMNYLLCHTVCACYPVIMHVLPAVFGYQKLPIIVCPRSISERERGLLGQILTIITKMTNPRSLWLNYWWAPCQLWSFEWSKSSLTEFIRITCSWVLGAQSTLKLLLQDILRSSPLPYFELRDQFKGSIGYINRSRSSPTWKNPLGSVNDFELYYWA